MTRRKREPAVAATRPTPHADIPAEWIAIAPDAVTLHVVARPGSTRRGFLRVDPRGLVVALHSPPDRGRANDELIDFLARNLRLPRTTIVLTRGAAAREKTVRIMTDRPREIAEMLTALVVEPA